MRQRRPVVTKKKNNAILIFFLRDENSILDIYIDSQSLTQIHDAPLQLQGHTGNSQGDCFQTENINTLK